MNPVVRHFLPSVVRGVYRADDEFSKIEDERGFKRFVEAKLKFLPSNVAAAFRRQLSLDEDFERAQRQQTLPDDLIEPVQTTAQRANAFFRLHTYFENALGTQAEIKEADNFLEIQFVRKVLAPLMSDAGLRNVQPQWSIGPYLVDFALEGASKFVIEVDGFGKFKERRDLDDFISRQNYITSQGWRVIRFTYGQIMESTGVTLKSLHTLLKGDAQLRRFLTVQWHTGTLLNFFTRSAGPPVMDVVNDFYRVEDWFVEMVLSAAGQSAGAVRLKDGFDLGVPFVALAISALYKFLEAVQSVVDVDFQLPGVAVGGCGRAGEWATELHGLVSLSDAGDSNPHLCQRRLGVRTMFVSNRVSQSEPFGRGFNTSAALSLATKRPNPFRTLFSNVSSTGSTCSAFPPPAAASHSASGCPRWSSPVSRSSSARSVP